MHLGSQSDPRTTGIYNTICASMPDKYYYNPQTGDVTSMTISNRALGCCTFILWSTAQTINDFPAGSTRIFSSADRNSYGDLISLEVYNP